jgi:glycine dehydrogenase
MSDSTRPSHATVSAGQDHPTVVGEAPDDLVLPPFAARHVGPDADAIATMLSTVGQPSLDALIDRAVPSTIRTDGPLDLPEAVTEAEVISELRALAARNRPAVAMIGDGYHRTHTPAVIRRNVLESPAWYTAYTPYQPEISQGRLEALLTFQTMVSDLTGLPIANASLLDEATAVAEAATLMRRTGGSTSDRVLVDVEVLPQTMAVLGTRCAPLGIRVEVFDPSRGLPEGEFFGVILQAPGRSGIVRDLAPVVAEAKARGAMVAVSADLLSLTLLAAPGSWGADIAVGSTQRFGVPMFAGGPHAAFMAVREGLERSLPGRLVGVSIDADGAPAYRLALQTREQHIRREKATSNICTAQVLLAVVAGLFAVWHGPEGLRSIALHTHRMARVLAAALRDGGVEPVDAPFLDTLTVRVPGQAAAIIARAATTGIDLGTVDDDHVRIACDETTTLAHLRTILDAFGVADPEESLARADRDTPPGTIALPGSLLRRDDYLTHPVFHRHRTETTMLRFLRRLSDADYALDRGMIPLGSCTMKLNATTEMESVSWPEFADIHPFSPASRQQGTLAIVADLERWLAEVTGYAAVSLQPNAGSQGEFAGLLAIAAWHRSRGESERDVCLIPSSAHGTNAASAVMAGMRVAVVAATDEGTVDLVDLQRQIAAHEGRVAAIMVTYPSTHGVFEAGITEVCRLVHEAGGQVYVDGANLNALLGVAPPGGFGADVSHLNLHKTFCIPHGGGGPGVGPVAVAEHLAPFLPTHPGHPDPARREGPVGPVSAAPLGSAGILQIPWTYVRLMGGSGLTHATRVAVLAANHVARRLDPAFPVLYTGTDGLVAHECIIDVRAITASTGITAEDVAKRLIDHGFHAPTLSFPVAGTLMIEPTESEDLAEIERFCTAMLSIRAEIARVESGEWPRDDNPLVNAPHTAEMLTREWSHPYPRDLAVYPSTHTRRAKYWPPVRRIDGARGDRNLACSCPPLSAFDPAETVQDAIDGTAAELAGVS